MQKMFHVAKIPKVLLNLVVKAYPPIGKAVAAMNDPMLLHQALHDNVLMIIQALEEDHAAGYGSADICEGVDIAARGEESSESVPSGGDGYREVNSDGSVDGGVQSGVFYIEATASSEDIDL
jgi:hypothetical protein